MAHWSWHRGLEFKFSLPLRVHCKTSGLGVGHGGWWQDGRRGRAADPGRTSAKQPRCPLGRRPVCGELESGFRVSVCSVLTWDVPHPVPSK